MTSSFAGLPPNLREIAEVAGLEAAMALARAYGGTQVTIPRRVGPKKHWLVECVGRKAAEKICDHYCVRDADGHAIGRFRMLIPLGSTGIMAQARLQLAQQLQSGELSVRKAARRAGLGERAAWRMKARMRSGGNSDQGDLF